MSGYMTKMVGVFIGTPIKRAVVIGLSTLFITNCPQATGRTMHGYAFLQDTHIKFDTSESYDSLNRMKNTGANAIVLVPFFRQSKISSGEIGFSDAVTDHQLLAAIEQARRLNLKVILKPQILVKYGWSGDIRFGSDMDEERWFGRYHDLLAHYARIAQREHVDALVIGTELTGIESSTRWRPLISDMRKIYYGKLSYVAHGIDGVRRFSAWKDLDAISVSLYPKLGGNLESSQIRAHIEQTLVELKDSTDKLLRPVWVLEVGMPSVQGALQAPWDWYRLSEEGAKPDMEVQKVAVGQWLQALDKPWIEAVFLWCWYSDPKAGGSDNNDYTLQNKPAENQVKCFWAHNCAGRQE